MNCRRPNERRPNENGKITSKIIVNLHWAKIGKIMYIAVLVCCRTQIKIKFLSL